MEFKVMLGVDSGYDPERKRTASDALAIGEEEWRKAVIEATSMPIDPENPESEMLYGIDGKIVPALAVYSKNFGCPEGGEAGIQVEAKMEDGQREDVFKKSVLETVKIFMANRGQSTATLEWSNEGKSIGTTYISDGGKSINENGALSGIEHFTVELGENHSNEEYVRTGSAIQKAMDTVSSTIIGDTKYYMISGVMTPTEDGKIQFSASQNPMYDQTDNTLYKKSVARTIQMVMRDIGQERADIDFDGEVIPLDLNELIKDQDEVDGIGE